MMLQAPSSRPRMNVCACLVCKQPLQSEQMCQHTIMIYRRTALPTRVSCADKMVYKVVCSWLAHMTGSCSLITVKLLTGRFDALRCW